MWRALSVVLAAGLILAGCQPKPETGLGYHKQTCSILYLGLKKVECGTLVFEETRGKTNGRTFALPIVIQHATDPKPKSDPVIFLHGGPGGDIVINLWMALRKTDRVTADRDWIFFDHRGTGKSSASFDCGNAPLSDAGVTSEAGVKVLSDCMAKYQAAGYDLTQYNSATIAKDIRDLRSALGITTYNLYGGSYGTRVAMAVMQHDPEGLRAAILSSTWPPEGNATAPLPALVSRETRQVLRYCEVDTACKAKYPNMEKRLDTLMTTWLAKPVIVKDRTYTADLLAAFLLDEIYSPEGANGLPKTLNTIIDGDYKALDNFEKIQAGYTEGQFFTTLCNEEFSFENPADLDKIDMNDPIQVATARDTKRFFAVCKAFNPGTPDPVENQPLTSDIPTLMLSADIDAGCPSELSDEAVKRLSHGRNFFFPNRTHTISGSDCAKAMIRQFLETADPNVDATCIKTDQPKFQFDL